MKPIICVIGAGYVGLPLGVAFSKIYETSIYAHSIKHASELREGFDKTNSFTPKELKESSLRITSSIEESRNANVYIITVPTPIDANMKPDLSAIKNATATVASVLQKGDVVVYESTVFIGCTEELCVPILEEKSGLTFNEEFFCGFSPERINPSDQEHTLESIVKIVSASTSETKDYLVKMYGSVVKAGIHEAPSIKVAEASKLLENIQRDVNIALVNQLSTLYAKLGVSTNDVIDAASTKWNFNAYRPGLVGGHCISVDPYYLLYNATQQNVSMSIIEEARIANEGVPSVITIQIEKLLKQRGRSLKGANALLLGISFKENCNDLRNSKSALLYNQLIAKGAIVDVVDPVVNAKEVQDAYGITVMRDIPIEKTYDLIIPSVAHDQFKKINWNKLKKETSVLYDIKNIVNAEYRDASL